MNESTGTAMILDYLPKSFARDGALSTYLSAFGEELTRINRVLDVYFLRQISLTGDMWGDFIDRIGEGYFNTYRYTDDDNFYKRRLRAMYLVGHGGTKNAITGMTYTEYNTGSFYELWRDQMVCGYGGGTGCGALVGCYDETGENSEFWFVRDTGESWGTSEYRARLVFERFKACGVEYDIRNPVPAGREEWTVGSDGWYVDTGNGYEVPNAGNTGYSYGYYVLQNDGIYNAEYNFEGEEEFDGNYRAEYSFTNDPNGSIPGDWYKGGDGSVQVIAEKDGHKKVVEFYDNANRWTWIFNNIIDQECGTIEFWYYEPDDDGYFEFRLRREGRNIGWLSRRWNNLLWAYNDGTSEHHTTICSAIFGEWVHVRIDFECSTGGYKGLAEDRVAIYINGELMGSDYILNDYGNNPPDVWEIGFTYLCGTEGYKYFDAVDFSWADGYYVWRNAYKFIPDGFDNNGGLYKNSQKPLATLNLYRQFEGHSNVLNFHYEDDGDPNVPCIDIPFGTHRSGAMEFWVYVKDTHRQFEVQILWGGTYIFKIYFHATETQYKWVDYNNVTHTYNDDPIPVNEWHRFMIKWDQDAQTGGFYKDGVLRKSVDSIFSNNINRAMFRTQIYSNVYDVFIDAIDFSWETGYTENRNKYPKYTPSFCTFYNSIHFTGFSYDSTGEMMIYKTLPTGLYLADTGANILHFHIKGNYPLVLEKVALYSCVIPYTIVVTGEKNANYEEYEFGTGDYLSLPADDTGNLMGVYSFTNVGEGINPPAGWEMISEPADSDWEIINNFDNHLKVWKQKNSTSDYTSAKTQFSAPRTNGTIEFFVQVSDTTNAYWYFDLLYDYSTNNMCGGIDFRQGDIHWRYKKGSTWYNITLQSFNANEWYHVRIDFECGTGQYEGLAEDQVYITINQTNVYNQVMYKAGTTQGPDFVEGVRVMEGFLGSYFTGYVDAIDFSWEDVDGLEYFDGRNRYYRRYKYLVSKAPYITKNVNQQLDTGEWSWVVLDFSAPDEIMEGTVSFENDHISGIGFILTGGYGEAIEVDVAKMSFEYKYTVTGDDLII